MKNKKKVVLFLFSELSQYFLKCVEQFINKYNASVHIIRWPVNKEAPFDLKIPEKIKIYERKNFDKRKILELCEKIKADIVISSGWMDKEYYNACKELSQRVNTVLTMDNQWRNSVKQNIAIILAPFTIKKVFKYVWVPGIRQKKYALKLGFSEKNIFLNFYSADLDLFNLYYEKFFNKKKKKFPKKFLYVARYVKHKGIYDLCKAFYNLSKKNKTKDWELWCLGTGKEFDYIKNNFSTDNIKHFGFIQSDKMEEFIKNTGVYVLPSKFEPWSVSLQEFAAAGFPLLCTYEVAASDIFLQNNKNGILFQKNNIKDLENAMIKIINSPEEKLIQMGEISHKLAQKITPQLWADTLNKILYL